MKNNTLQSLSESIQDISNEPMDATAAMDAASNLTGFFNLLIEIEREQSSSNPNNTEEDNEYN